MPPTPNNEALTDQELQSLRNLGNECERAADEIASLRAALASSGQAASAVPTLRERLQQRCSDWGVYWRASDAHGVDLSHEQALDLLRDALGVEVEIATPAAPAQPPAADNMPAWECIAMLLAEQDGQDPHHLIWEGNPPEPYGEVWCKYEFKARQIADLFATPPAPRAPSIEPVGEALERLTLWARTQVGRCECTGDHPIADAERALGWRK